jgi:tetratricopeptide (TPR) repeat protein
MKTLTKRVLFVALLGALSGNLLACGAPVTTGLGPSKAVPPPPPAPPKGEVVKEEPKRQISRDARKDYLDAMQDFLSRDKSGWDESACDSSAETFADIARDHRELVEAQYMVGLSYHRCNQLDRAEKAYQAALAMKSTHAQSLSNLGEIYFQAGKADGAKQYWERALQSYPKLIAARTNLASLAVTEMRSTTDLTRWKQLETSARDHLSSVLAVDNDNIKAYALYALVYMEGWQRNKNRLDLAKLLIDEAAKRKEDYAPLKNARGLYFMHRNNLSQALEQFQAAVKLDPRFVEARMNVGLTTLGFRNFDAAREQFAAVIELAPKNYDAVIGLGIALRGKGDFDGAEAQYKRAREINGSRGEAYFNLGVLYKEFKANKQSDLAKSKADYQAAREFFREFLGKSGISEGDKDEAQANIKGCDLMIKQLDEFSKPS